MKTGKSKTTGVVARTHRVRRRVLAKQDPEMASMTKQAYKRECDINEIMARFQKTGIVDHINAHQAQYGETTGQSFHDAMNLVADATSMFNELPADARKFFANDPARFLEFVEDPENHDKLVDLGLAERSIKYPTELVSDEEHSASGAMSGIEKASEARQDKSSDQAAASAE